MSDSARLWRMVTQDVEKLREAAPDGYEPTVEVFLLGRTKAIRPLEVVTWGESEFRWTVIVDDEEPGPRASPGYVVVYVPTQHIERVEIRFVRSEGRPVGFSHREESDVS